MRVAHHTDMDEKANRISSPAHLTVTGDQNSHGMLLEESQIIARERKLEERRLGKVPTGVNLAERYKIKRCRGCSENGSKFLKTLADECDECHLDRLLPRRPSIALFPHYICHWHVQGCLPMIIFSLSSWPLRL
jgi:hypothetical protein